MASYAEYLKENGATDEDIKILDTPVARKAHEKMEAKAAAAEDKAARDLKARQEWAETVETQNQQYLRERDTALVNEAKAAAAFDKMQKLGLIDIAEKIEPGSTKQPDKVEPTFDTSKFVDRDTLMAVAEREGDAIAIAQDISFEHSQLFGSDPSKRLNFRELRREAVSRKVPVESLWMEKYGVQAARDAKAATDKAAYEKRIREDAVTEYKSAHSETNPLTAPNTISKTPFTTRVPSAGDANRVQPWNKSDGEKEHSRMTKVLQSLQSQGMA